MTDRQTTTELVISLRKALVSFIAHSQERQKDSWRFVKVLRLVNWK